ncbi:hypothetical protein DFH06DRAFT_1481105 [Mycena polygramma]|nr:hypothetical protein DFH06DRAFT_1481105 [Mycena polygramma]
MSTTRVRQKRPNKPPACDSCKARRVLCHPQLNGAPCPRCAEKKIICTTTPVVRGRPKATKSTMPETAPRSESGQELAVVPQMVQASSSSMTLLSPQVSFDSLPECPDLTPDLVAHLFDCFDHLTLFRNSPIIIAASIKSTMHSVSFQLPLLKPQSRVLALCIIALSSLLSFHEAILGPGYRPVSLSDTLFFSSKMEVRNGGARRAPRCRALHAAALRAAWDAGIMLQVSNENAASCFLLDILEQCVFVFSGLSRPWAAAYFSHLRALAPIWDTSYLIPYSSHWAGFLMSEALLSTRSRKPMLFTHEDQVLLCGPDPRSAEDLLVSLEASSNKPGVKILTHSMRPYTFHISRIARQLWTTITGDHIRRNALSESAVLQFLSSLSLLHAILSRLLVRADDILAGCPPPSHEKWTFPLRGASDEVIVRRCGYGVAIGFTELVFAFHRELELRADAGDAPSYDRERMRLLQAQAREMTTLAIRELARAIRYLPTVHFDPMQRGTLQDYAQIALQEAEAAPVVDPERVRDLKTIADQLGMTAYSLDLSSSQDTMLLLQRLDQYVETASQPADFFDPDRMLADLLLPLDQSWMDTLPEPPILT